MGRYTQARRRATGAIRLPVGYPIALPPVPDVDFGVIDNGGGHDGVGNTGVNQILPQHYRYRTFGTSDAWVLAGGLINGDANDFDTGLTGVSVEWQAAWFDAPAAGTQLSDWSASIVVDNV